MKIRMLVLVLLAVTSAFAFADDKKKNSGGASDSSSTAKTKVRIPKYIEVTKAGSIAIYDPSEAPANPAEIEDKEKDGEVSWVGIDKLVHRAYTQEHLAKIRATFGDAIGDLAQEAHDVGGRTRIKDVLNLKRALEIIGTPDAKADAIVKEYLKNPTGKKRDEAIEGALADNKLIPGGLKGTGRTLGGLLELAANHALLGGEDPTKSMTPGFVKGFDDVKHGRKSLTDFIVEFGAALGESSDADPGTDPNESPSDPNQDSNDGDDGGGDELGGGFQSEDHSDTERGGEGPTDPPVDDQGSGDNGGEAPDQGGEDPDEGGGATYTVDSVTENEDGTTSYVFHVEGSDGDDGSYTTTYYDDGTYVTTDNDTGEVVGQGTGTAPDKVQPGDSTTTTDGDEAIFPTEDEEEEDGEEEEEEETEETPSTEFTPAPDGEGAPLPDDIQSMIDALLAADIAKLKGNGGSEGDDEDCGGDGKHKFPGASTKMSVVEAAAIEQARKLKMIGNPEGVEHHGGGPIGDVPMVQDNGDIDYGPDHVDPREGSGVSRVDPRGTKKIGADHHNDDPGQKEGSGAAGPGASSSGGSSGSSSSDDSSKGKSKVKQIGAAAKLKKVDAGAKVKAAVDAFEPQTGSTGTSKGVIGTKPFKAKKPAAQPKATLAPKPVLAPKPALATKPVFTPKSVASPKSK